MKSQSDNLLCIISGICKDIRMAYPTLKGLDRDFETCSSTLLNRGLGFFTLDLPERESALLRGLESGFLCASGTKRYSKHYPVPRLFAGLYMKIFDKELNLKSDADVNALAFLRQLLVVGKKIEVPCSKKRELAAIKEYVHVEQSLVKPTLRWWNDTLDYHGARSRVHLCDDLGPDLPLYPEYNIGRTAREKLLLDRCQRVADAVAAELGTFCPDCFIEGRREEGRGLGFRHGPGAVAERSGRFYDKNQFRNWSAKLESLYPFSTSGKMPLDSRPDRLDNHEVPARLICVPKTAKGPRIIAAEPSEHMFCQNLFADWLIDRIRTSKLRNFIDFKSQSKSGKLVLKASRDGSLATIDLSSASDRLSLFVIERVFRSNPSILRAIHGTRTRWLRLPNGECLELKKFASQGTALTFPVQTLVFLVIALASSLDGPFEDDKYLQRLVSKVRVYGDDIIVPCTRYADTVALLTTLQLRVNTEKSFHRGHFRESCGVDAFRGYDVTPIKPKTTVSDNPASCQAILDTLNNLFYKGYWNASRELEHRQPPRNLSGYGVVGRDAGATGFGSFSASTAYRRLFEDFLGLGNLPRGSTGLRRCYGVRYSFCPQTIEQEFFRMAGGDDNRTQIAAARRRTNILRWNSRLHRFEVRAATLKSSTTERPFDDGYSGLLQRQLRPPNPEVLSTNGIRGVPERPRLRKVTRWEALSDLF